MYLEHYGLSEYPFSITPDTSYYFGFSSHQEALNVLLVALETGEGFLKVTGEVGLGKTLLCRLLLNSLDDQFVTAYLPNPHLSPWSMRLSVAEELGLTIRGRPSQEQLLKGINERLIQLAGEGKRVVLCLDEAQQLPLETLEAIRLLTNLETEKRKLIQVVMFGQPELDQRLGRGSVRQLRQRITFSYDLQPMDRDAVSDYIDHRLRIAGYRGAPLFSRGAIERIYRASRGTPRLVNILCHKALLAGYGPGARRITARHASQAIADTEGASKGTLAARAGAWLAAASVLVFAGAWFAHLYLTGSTG